MLGVNHEAQARFGATHFGVSAHAESILFATGFTHGPWAMVPYLGLPAFSETFELSQFAQLGFG